MFEQAVEADKIANRWNQYGRASRELSDGLYIFFANPVRRMTFILIGGRRDADQRRLLVFHVMKNGLRDAICRALSREVSCLDWKNYRRTRKAFGLFDRQIEH